MNLRSSICLLSLLAFISGCGDAPTAAPKQEAKAKKKKAEEPPQPPKIEVKPDAYPNVPAAFDAIIAAQKENDQKTILIAEEWIKLQGAAVAPVLIETLKNEQAPLASRIASCRGLSRLGATGKGPLLEALQSPTLQLRLKACDSLGMMKPPDKEVVAKMIELVDGPDARLRLSAVNAIRNIGPAAKAAEPKLLAILNSQKEEDTLRAAAKAALKSAAPRKTFDDP